MKKLRNSFLRYVTLSRVAIFPSYSNIRLSTEFWNELYCKY